MKKITNVIFLLLLSIILFSCATKNNTEDEGKNTLIDEKDLILKWDHIDRVYEKPLPLPRIDENGNIISDKN